MEKCYDFLDCPHKKDCPASKAKDDIECWDIEGTLFHSETLRVMAKHSCNKCGYCQYLESRYRKG